MKKSQIKNNSIIKVVNNSFIVDGTYRAIVSNHNVYVYAPEKTVKAKYFSILDINPSCTITRGLKKDLEDEVIRGKTRIYDQYIHILIVTKKGKRFIIAGCRKFTPKQAKEYWGRDPGDWGYIYTQYYDKSLYRRERQKKNNWSLAEVDRLMKEADRRGL